MLSCYVIPDGAKLKVRLGGRSSGMTWSTLKFF